MNPNRPNNADALAGRFLARLCEAIGFNSIRLVAELNAAETVEGVCHSHDFCDANEVMLIALDDLGLPSPVGDDERARDEGEALVNEAWATFRRRIEAAWAEA